jgi:hypothetical protein
MTKLANNIADRQILAIQSLATQSLVMQILAIQSLAIQSLAIQSLAMQILAIHHRVVIALPKVINLLFQTNPKTTVVPNHGNV